MQMRPLNTYSFTRSFSLVGKEAFTLYSISPCLRASSPGDVPEELKLEEKVLGS